MTKTPHKHAEAIRAWANGDEIEFRAPDTTAWVWSPAPAWVEDHEYRVKPVRSYPATRMGYSDLFAAFEPKIDGAWNSEAAENVANAALRHAIDNGQVVTRHEFDCAIGDRDKRDMAVADAIAASIAMRLNPVTALSLYKVDLRGIIAKVPNVQR